MSAGTAYGKFGYGIIAIDRMKFAVGKTELFVKISSSNSEGALWGPWILTQMKTGKSVRYNFPVISVSYLASPRGFEPLSPA